MEKALDILFSIFFIYFLLSVSLCLCGYVFLGVLNLSTNISREKRARRVRGWSREQRS